ncbi:MAG: hypothetical protein ACI898_001788, partial [Flavobacteriales bacterium]
MLLLAYDCFLERVGFIRVVRCDSQHAKISGVL